MDRSILKDNAKKNLQKNHWNCVAVAFLMALSANSLPVINISGLPTESSDFSDFTNEFEGFFSSSVATTMGIAFVITLIIVSVISAGLKIFVFNTMTVGGSRYFLKSRKNQPTDTGEVFTNFKDKTFFNIAKTSFIRDLYTVLFTMLFIIPGIIKAYEYFAVRFILAVRPDINSDDALRLSKEIMKGHKFDLFILNLSFLGWDFLTLFTCGILSILYVNPYKQATLTEFFCYVREDAVARGVISPFDIPDYEPYIPPAPATPFYTTTLGMNTYPQSFTGQPIYPQAPVQNAPVTQNLNQQAPVSPTTPIAPQEPENTPQATQVVYPEATTQENTPSNEETSAEEMVEESNPTTEE